MERAIEARIGKSGGDEVACAKVEGAAGCFCVFFFFFFFTCICDCARNCYFHCERHATHYTCLGDHTCEELFQNVYDEECKDGVYVD